MANVQKLTQAEKILLKFNSKLKNKTWAGIYLKGYRDDAYINRLLSEGRIFQILDPIDGTLKIPEPVLDSYINDLIRERVKNSME